MKSLMENKTTTTKNPCFEPCIWGSLWWGILVSWLLLVCLLLVGISGAVLDIGWAWTQSIQVTTILGVINVILKKHLSHLEESHSCEERVRPCLMLRSNSLQFKLLCHLLQTTLHITWCKSDRFLLFTHTATNESNPWYTSRPMLQWWQWCDPKWWNKKSAMAIHTHSPPVFKFYCFKITLNHRKFYLALCTDQQKTNVKVKKKTFSFIQSIQLFNYNYCM